MKHPQIQGFRLEDPPIIELVLSVQFEMLPLLGIPELGLLWSEFKGRYPRAEVHPPVRAIFERFDKVHPPSPEIEVTEEVPIPRWWFLNETGDQLVQVQRDRFMFNWRRSENSSEYPRFPAVRAKFRQELDIFMEFLLSSSLGELRFSQCEVTYIDHIQTGSSWSTHNQIEKVLSVWEPPQAIADAIDLEDASFRMRFRIPGNDGKPIGRVRVEFDPALSLQGHKPLFRMNTTARGKPLCDGVDGVFQFFDIAHDWVIHIFRSLTTDTIRREWGEQ